MQDRRLHLESGKANCASIAIDNAAVKMANELRMMVSNQCAQNDAKKACPPIIVSRDLAHCLDLGPKDLVMEKEFVKPVLSKSLELIKLVCIDRINGIKRNL